MRRLFYKGLLQDTIEITGADAHHLMHVMRARPGQEIIIVDDRASLVVVDDVGVGAGSGQADGESLITFMEAITEHIDVDVLDRFAGGRDIRKHR